MMASETVADLHATFMAARAAHEERNRPTRPGAWQRAGKHLQRAAEARGAAEDLYWIEVLAAPPCDLSRLFWRSAADWAESARLNAEERAAEKVLLPPLERLLAGLEVSLAVLDDGPHEFEGREFAGYFVSLRTPKAVWPEVERRLEAAGLGGCDAEEDDGEMSVWLDDCWVGACPWGCGSVRVDVERHAGRCGWRPAVRGAAEPTDRPGRGE